MAGINQGRPELAVGEPIRLGSNEEFEIEQHPVSDRLIIRDTQNGKVAYVRKERGGEIGGDGVLIKALKESKPMADDGRTYDTIQEAEEEASSWVFVPTGTYNESVKINTEGLTLQGCGYNTLIDGGSNESFRIKDENVSISNLSVKSSDSDGRGIVPVASDFNILNVNFLSTEDNTQLRIGSDFSRGLIANSTFKNGGSSAINTGSGEGGEHIISNNIIESADANGIISETNNCIIANNIINSTSVSSIIMEDNNSNSIIIGNRVSNSESNGITIIGENCIVANNRVSDSTDTDISDDGTNTLLDGNLTGASN